MPDENDDEVDNGRDLLGCGAVCFLRINATLESLTLVYVLVMSVISVLRQCPVSEDTSLEYLECKTDGASALSNISRLSQLWGPNKALKTLRLHQKLDSFDSDQVKEVLSFDSERTVDSASR
jgi:hypothetical protein